MTWSRLHHQVAHEFRAAQRMARGIIERVGDDEPVDLGPRPEPKPSTLRRRIVGPAEAR